MEAVAKLDEKPLKNRFDHWNELLAKPIHNCLAKTRLKVLGENKQSASRGIIPKRGRLPRKATKLKPFNREIPQAAKDRFDDLVQLFRQPLIAHLDREMVKFTAISIRLKVLGENEESARPWIVILCDETVLQRVRQFFGQQQVRSEYQSRDPKSPSFEVLVCGRPPKSKATTTPTAIYSVSWDDPSM